MSNIFESARNNYNYKEFVQLAADLLKEGKTTGEKQSAEYTHYAKLNLQRMQRWDKTYELPEELTLKIKNMPEQTWWVITEAWCGDSAQNLPVLAKIAATSQGKINLKIVLRDENPDIMNRYLTNGSKSIPILVVLYKQDEEIFKWGPRPSGAQQMMNAWKKDPKGKSFEDFEIDIQQWYNKDKGGSLLAELQPLL